MGGEWVFSLNEKLTPEELERYQTMVSEQYGSENIKDNIIYSHSNSDIMKIYWNPNEEFDKKGRFEFYEHANSDVDSLINFQIKLCKEFKKFSVMFDSDYMDNSMLDDYYDKQKKFLELQQECADYENIDLMIIIPSSSEED
ncbi:MAG TPA: hypothetical protein PLS49_03745 [Candidatus Woesebacteria bacterium]|nr:hypothetical protein [Candidatus Woesebacteria bacterium]